MSHHELPSSGGGFEDSGPDVPASDEVLDANRDRLVRSAGLLCIGASTICVANTLCDAIAAEGIASKVAVGAGGLWVLLSGHLREGLVRLDQMLGYKSR
jgi:hypothetical protein